VNVGIDEAWQDDKRTGVDLGNACRAIRVSANRADPPVADANRRCPDAVGQHHTLAANDERRHRR
jgi:hypothetical protein